MTASPDAHLRLLRAALEAAANAIMITDRSGIIEWVNPAFTTLTGYARSEAVGRSPGDLVHSGQHDAAFYRELWETLLRGEVWQGRMVNRRKDGSLYPEDQVITPVPDETGRIAHFIAIKEDATARERVGFQAQLLDAVGEAVIATDLDGRIRYWNRSAEAMFGWSADEVMGRDTIEVTAAGPTHDQAAEIMARLAAGESWSGEFSLVRRDGTVFPGHITDTPLRDATGQVVGVVGVTRDLSRRHQLEQQLRQGQKLEAVGRLAGGIAHDLNNVLTSILGHNQLILDRLEAGPLRDDADQVRRDAQRAARLVQQILGFSRKQMVRPVVFELSATVRDLERMLRPLVRESIELRVRADDDGRVEADQGQVEQVVMNLAINAMDAIPAHGTVTISVGRTELGPDHDDRFGDPPEPGSYMVLEVTDDGQGMDATTMERIFDPFFTTKDPGAGTGLGLATVYGIVSQAGGQVGVESEPGRGSTFRVFLPRTDRPAEPDAEASAGRPATDAADQAVRILLVEDDPSVRSLARRVLERAGHAVIEAESGGVALHILAADPDPEVRLLITDVIMPGMSGVELAERLLDSRPGLPVLFMSGYAEAEVLRRGRLGSAHGFIAKPFTPDDLNQAVRDALTHALR